MEGVFSHPLAINRRTHPCYEYRYRDSGGRAQLHTTATVQRVRAAAQIGVDDPMWQWLKQYRQKKLPVTHNSFNYFVQFKTVSVPMQYALSCVVFTWTKEASCLKYRFLAGFILA